MIPITGKPAITRTRRRFAQISNAEGITRRLIIVSAATFAMALHVREAELALVHDQERDFLTLDDFLEVRNSADGLVAAFERDLGRGVLQVMDEAHELLVRAHFLGQSLQHLVEAGAQPAKAMRSMETPRRTFSSRTRALIRKTEITTKATATWSARKGR